MQPSAEPAEKVFHVKVGERDLHFDPFEVHCAWHEATGGDPAALLRAVQPPQPQKVPQPDGSFLDTDPEESPEMVLARLKAYRQLIAAARKTFDLPPIDRSTGQGVTDHEVMRVVNEWYDYQDGVKKNIESSPNSAPPTTSTPTAAPAPTKKSSGCGCS